MSLSNEERFCELAHKAIAKEAQPAEQAELQALLAENPTLKKEFEEMGAEAAIAREILPLLEDIQHPTGRIPQPPIERLKREVGKVFAQRRSKKRELRELLDRLETWASGAMRAEGRQVMELLATLRASVSEMRELRPAAAALVSTMLFEESPRFAPRGRSEKEQRRQAEFEERLRRLEERIGEIERTAHESIARMAHDCTQEVRALLNELKREAGSRTDVKSADPSEQR